MTEPIHDPSCRSLRPGTDHRGYGYDAGDAPCDCEGIGCDNCESLAEFGSKETACGRNHCATHFARCKACQDDLADEWEDIA